MLQLVIQVGFTKIQPFLKSSVFSTLGSHHNDEKGFKITLKIDLDTNQILQKIQLINLKVLQCLSVYRQK